MKKETGNRAEAEDGALLSAAVPLLCRWYRENRKPLPWRLDPTPYHIWISEIMLQQTRIEAVIPYYHRFLTEFPTIEALAEADEERLMKLWQGLGYYSRARNLKKAAERIMREEGGRLPDSAEALRRLPGIGAYTAGAIASIAYQKAEPAVDGNVLRVVSRLLADDSDILQPATVKRITAALARVYPEGRDAALLTEGLMELGETICLPNGAPGCAFCPVSALCRAAARGETERYPRRSPKKPRTVVGVTVWLLRCGDRWAIRKRPDRGLLAGMWELPTEEEGRDTPGLPEEQGIEVLSVTPCGEARHIFTHVEWRMKGRLAECGRENGDFVWATREELIDRYAIPTAFRAFLPIMKQDGD